MAWVRRHTLMLWASKLKMDNLVSSAKPQQPTEAPPSHYTDKTLRLVDSPSTKPILMKELLPDGTAMVLYNVLSPSECKHYMDEAERMGMLQLDGRSRVTERCIAKSADVARLVFDRCSTFLSPIHVPKPSGAYSSETKDTQRPDLKGIPVETPFGTWLPIGLNECFRLCRYRPGGFFKPHYDYGYSPSEEETSLKTFMIYLNDADEFQGGPTNFYNDHQQHYVHPDPANVIRSFRPRQGCALVFNSNITHDGGELTGGVKWIMRSEAMYRRQAHPDDPPKVELAPDQIEARRLLTEAKMVEFHDPMGAMRLYRRAYKLDGSLETDSPVYKQD